MSSQPVPGLFPTSRADPRKADSQFPKPRYSDVRSGDKDNAEALVVSDGDRRSHTRPTKINQTEQTGQGSETAERSQQHIRVRPARAPPIPDRINEKPRWLPQAPSRRSAGLPAVGKSTYETTDIQTTALDNAGDHESTMHWTHNSLASQRSSWCIVGTIAEHYDKHVWSANQLEDTLSENVVKTGFSDKPQVTPETSSCRATLAPQLNSLDHGTGLDIVSALLTSVLQQRRENGRVSSNSTFKPPPRVTLTDTKREEWLRNLADPNLPLRRLSRSIPHSIRGKALLEHCLAKMIPFHRALWFAKCVGANELRAFRRKALGGATTTENELRWIRDWTITVESFMEDAVASYRKENWKSRVNYVIKLVARFYAAQLLDRKHFLDWLLDRFGESSTEGFVFYLLMIRLFWTELLASFTHSRQLARNCLLAIVKLSDGDDQDLYEPVKQKLSGVVLQLALAQPQCFLFPDIVDQKLWERMQSSLLIVFSRSPQVPPSLQQSIRLRNERLRRACIRTIGPVSPLQAAWIHDLDALHHGNILELASNPESFPVEQRVSILLQWASTRFRSKPHRPFIAVRILREYAKSQHDLTDLIITALGASRSMHGLDEANFSRAVIELVKLGRVDTNRYLRWMMSSGALSSPETAEKASIRSCTCEVRILLDLPQACLSDRMVALRKTLLRSVGFSSTHEVELTFRMKGDLIDSDATMFIDNEKRHRLTTSTSLGKPREIPYGVAFDIAQWILECATAVVKKSLIHEQELGSSSCLFARINLIRRSLHELQQFSQLAEFMRLVIDVGSVELVSHMTHLVELDLDTFQVIEVARGLADDLLKRHRALGMLSLQRIGSVQSLIRIFAQIPEALSVLQGLKHEFTQCDHSAVMAACTPVSNASQDGSNRIEKDSVEELEQLYFTGGMLAQSTFREAFQNILEAILTRQGQSSEIGPLVALLARLRGMDDIDFDGILSHWITFRRSGNPQFTSELLARLIGCNCTSFLGLIRLVDDSKELLLQVSNLKADHLSVCIIQLWSLDCTYTAGECSDQLYKFELKRRAFLEQQPRRAFSFLMGTLQSDMGNAEGTIDRLGSVLKSTAISVLFENSILDDCTEVRMSLQKLRSSSGRLVRLAVKEVLFHLADPQEHLKLSHMSSGEVVTTIFDTVDGLSSEFYQLLLDLLVEETSDDRDQLQAALLDASYGAARRGCSYWIQLLHVASMPLVREIREQTESALLLSEPEVADLPLILEHLAFVNSARDASIIESSGYSIPVGGATEASILIIRNLDVCVRTLLGDDETTAKLANEDRPKLEQWFNALLLAAVVHHEGIESSAEATLISMYCGMTRVLITGSTTLTRYTLERCFDAAAFFAIVIPPSTLAAVWETLPNWLAQNSRIRHLLDFSNSPHNSVEVTTAKATTVSSPTDVLPSSSTTLPLRRWELLPESAPHAGPNEAALALRLFNAHKMPS